ncbi:MAG: hypothetical protein Q8K92_06740, partial [Leadbetterella sp.]|nr:hypothetical protein [Leadbetterella sp.]
SHKVTECILGLLSTAQNNLSPANSYYLALTIEKILAAINMAVLAKYNTDEKVYNLWDSYRHTSWWVAVLGPNLYLLIGTLGAADRNKISESIMKIKAEYATLVPQTEQKQSSIAEEQSLTAVFSKQLSDIYTQFATSVNAATQGAATALAGYMPASASSIPTTPVNDANKEKEQINNMVEINSLNQQLDKLIHDCDSTITTTYIKTIQLAANNLSAKNAYIFAKTLEGALTGATSYGLPKTVKGEAMHNVTSTHGPSILNSLGNISLSDFTKSIGGLASCATMYKLFEVLSKKDQDKILEAIVILEKNVPQSDLLAVERLNQTIQATVISAVNTTATTIVSAASTVVTNAIPA